MAVVDDGSDAGRMRGCDYFIFITRTKRESERERGVGKNAVVIADGLAIGVQLISGLKNGLGASGAGLPSGFSTESASASTSA